MAYQQKNRVSATDRLAEEALANRRLSAPRKTNRRQNEPEPKRVTRKPGVVADSPAIDVSDKEDDDYQVPPPKSRNVRKTKSSKTCRQPA